MRTKNEIKKEIAALKALKPVGLWKGRTEKSIELAILELEHGYDDTAEEYNELTDTERDIIQTARAWKESLSDDRPSQGWGSLVV